MTDLEVYFDERPWESAIAAAGEQICALQLLTALEGADDLELEEAVETLARRHIRLDLSKLPPVSGNNPSAERLAREQKLVQQGKLREGLEENDPLRLYLEEVAATPAAGDPQLLATRLAEGDRSVIDQLLTLLLSRCISTAQEYVGKGVLLADLIQEASLGLWQSLQSYEGGDFEDHCDWWIRHFLSSAVMLQARESGVGQKLRQALEDYRSVDERLLTELGRNPTPEEMAEGLHISVEETLALGEMLENARAMERVKTPEPKDLPQEEDQAVEDTAYFQMRQRIADLLSGLSERDAQLLSLRYGLEGGLPLKPEETARRMGLTPEEVLEIEAAALGKLRQTK